MRTLGAIIAGGKSRRYGSDKGAAQLNGRALIDHVYDGLRPQVDVMIIVGRTWPKLLAIEDRPAPGLGPLGGLCAALHYALENGFDRVLTAGCDVLPVPLLRDTIDDAALVVSGQYMLGHWPVALAAQLDDHLTSQTNLSLRHWISVCGARQIDYGMQFHNLNKAADAAQLAAIFPPPES